MALSVVWSRPAPPVHIEPTHCILCGRPLGKTFVYGLISTLSREGTMDLRCHRVAGLGLGRGRGRLYRRQPDGRWIDDTP